MSTLKATDGIAKPMPALPDMVAPKDDPAVDLAKHLVALGVSSLVTPVTFAEMDFVVTVSRKAEYDAAQAKAAKDAAHAAKMNNTLTHLAIIGERCDVKAAALKGLEP